MEQEIPMPPEIVLYLIQEGADFNALPTNTIPHDQALKPQKWADTNHVFYCNCGHSELVNFETTRQLK